MMDGGVRNRSGTALMRLPDRRVGEAFLDVKKNGARAGPCFPADNSFTIIDHPKEEAIMKIMKTATEKRIAFRENLKSGHIMIAPGVGDALGAKIAEMAGIPALAMGGYSVSASRLGQPDVGLLSCTEMAEQLTGICNAVNIPIIADGDTGYGNALNIIRTEQMFEQAGAACIFFEDQAWPKRCGHMDGKQVISAEEHAQKIRAAVDARFDKETMIMSRTDSRAVYGIDDAIERSKR